MDSSQTPTKAIIGLVVVVLLVVAATAAVIASGNNKDSSASQTSTTSSNTTSTSSSSGSTASVTNVKDGTYTASASYDTPGGVQDIKVILIIAGGAVSDSSITQNATGREDEAYQSAFESEYKTAVVGKKISDISLNRVAGASLTTEGFNTALLDIAKQAQA